VQAWQPQQLLPQGDAHAQGDGQIGTPPQHTTQQPA